MEQSAKQFIQDRLLTKAGGLNPTLMRNIPERFPDFYNTYIKGTELEPLPMSEAIYRLYTGITPACKVEGCNGVPEFWNFKKGYAPYCSMRCAQISPDVNEKRKETQYKKFGGFAFVTEEGYKKAKKTKLERYGNENYLNMEKAKKTKQERYGADNYASVKEKLRKTNLERYGYELNFKSEGFQERSNKIRWAKALEGYKAILAEKGMRWMPDQEFRGWEDRSTNTYKKYFVHCDRCKSITMIDYRLRCLHCFPSKSKTSDLEAELVMFLEAQGIKELKQSFRCLYVCKTNPQEIDIYSSEHKIGLEINSAYFHNAGIKPQGYHQTKTQLALKQGIKLYHIWDIDYWKHQNLIKSMLLNIFNKTPNKLNARDLIIKQPTSQEVIRFLSINHLHGVGRSSTYQSGLYTKDNELVMLITVAKDGELLRLATKKFTIVRGGFSKLFKSLKDKIKYTYAYEDLTPDPQDSVYVKSGLFEYKRTTQPSLLYYNEDLQKVEPRQTYQKHKMKELFEDYNNQPVNQFLLSKKIFPIYTSGNHYYEVKK